MMSLDWLNREARISQILQFFKIILDLQIFFKIKKYQEGRKYSAFLTSDFSHRCPIYVIFETNQNQIQFGRVDMPTEAMTT